MVKNLRIERIAHYILFVFLGAGIAFLKFPSISFNWNDWLSMIVLCLAFFYAWEFAVCTNDMADEEIDKISNPNRPLVTGILNKQDMEQLAIIFLTLSFFSGFLAGYTSLFFILAFNALYYIYSVPPTRFKLFPIISSFMISLCYLSATMAGFFLVSPIKEVSIFPTKLTIAVVVIITLLSNVKDIKDLAGDKKAGIKTLPVILGPTWGPRIVGVLAAISFICIPLFSNLYILFISVIPTAIFYYYFINKKPYREAPLILTYLSFIILSIFILIIYIF